MKSLKNVIGAILIIVGVISGLYVSIWSMFIQPILDACRAFDAGTLTGTIIGITIIKCIFSSTVGSLIVTIGCKVGAWLMED